MECEIPRFQLDKFEKDKFRLSKGLLPKPKVFFIANFLTKNDGKLKFGVYNFSVLLDKIKKYLGLNLTNERK